jgi:DNA-binding transcriptional MerR regulator
MTQAPTAGRPSDAGASWTIDELAGLVSMTVRTIRYYATLGLIPQPERRGRMAYYDARHRSRLHLVRTMQEQGTTLSAIMQQMAQIGPEATAEEIEMRMALAASWTPQPAVLVDRAELERQAGRPLSSEDLSMLERLGTVRVVEDGYEVAPTFEVGVGLLDVDIPIESMEAAGEAIQRHMDALVIELQEILRRRVLGPMRDRHDPNADPDRFAQHMSRLRQLTFDAIVANFQQAASGLADGSLTSRHERPDR